MSTTDADVGGCPRRVCQTLAVGIVVEEWSQAVIGSRPSDHYFRSVCLFVCLFVCAEFSSAVFDPISIKLGNMLSLIHI